LRWPAQAVHLPGYIMTLKKLPLQPKKQTQPQQKQPGGVAGTSKLYLFIWELIPIGIASYRRKEKPMPHVGVRHGGQRLQGSKLKLV